MQGHEIGSEREAERVSYLERDIKVVFTHEYKLCVLVTE